MEGQDKGKKGEGASPLMIGIVVLVIIIAGVGGWFAWQGIQASKPVPIGDILADLRTYDGQLVHVKGEVTNTMNLVVKWFELTDETGTITVVTERGLPTIGTTVEVDGTVDELFNIGGISKTVILEMPAKE